MLKPDMAEFLAPQQPAAPTAPAYGETNTITSKEKYEAAKARLKAGLNRIGSGIDPTLMPDAIIVGMYHVEAGVRKFADFAKAVIEDIGENVKPYLASAYMAARNDPQLRQFRAEFDTQETVDRLADEMEAPAEETPTVAQMAPVSFDSGDTKKNNSIVDTDDYYWGFRIE